MPILERIWGRFSHYLGPVIVEAVENCLRACWRQFKNRAIAISTAIVGRAVKVPLLIYDKASVWVVSIRSGHLKAVENLLGPRRRDLKDRARVISAAIPRRAVEILLLAQYWVGDRIRPVGIFSKTVEYSFRLTIRRLNRPPAVARKAFLGLKGRASWSFS